MTKPVIDKKSRTLIIMFCVLLTTGHAFAEIESTTATGFQAPPAKKFEQRGEPPAWDHVWVDGYWNWEKKGWVWHPGKYVQAIQERPPVKNHDFRTMPPSRNHVWVPGEWTFEAGDWTWQKGHFKPKPFRNAFWHAGYWRHQAPGWVWIDGHW
jgi:hypothetical protein